MSPLLLVPQDMILALVECAGGNDILLIVVLFFLFSFALLSSCYMLIPESGKTFQ